ncbi:MAG: hypothetical protein JXR53_15420 [Bacteroidales bacterium]|nr:hypothetical protein [Bacteroidales bacterium]
MNTKELLEKVFEVLNKSGLDYVVQNKYEMMPEKIPSDIDMFYRNADEKRLDEIVKEVARATEMIIVQKIANGSRQFAYMLSFPAPSTFFFFQLDFYSVLTVKRTFKQLYDPAEMLDRKRFYKCFHVPAPFDEFYYMIIRRTLKKDLSDEHLIIIREKFFVNEEDHLTKLSSLFENKLLRIVLQMINENDKSLFYENYNMFYAHLIKCAKRNRNIIKWVKHLWFIFDNIIPQRIIHKCGMSAVFLSPDGGGKSTLIKNIQETCGGSFHGTEVKYFRPRLLRNAGHYKIKNQTAESDDNPDPHGRPINGIIKSLYRYFFYNVDFILGTWFRVIPMKIQRKLIIFDRYYYDYYVDMKRYQYNLPDWFPRLFSFMIPKPDLVFILDAPADILYERKKELSLAEIERQRNKYLNLALNLKNAHIINSHQTLEKVTEDVTRIILSNKAEQTRKILY